MLFGTLSKKKEDKDVTGNKQDNNITRQTTTNLTKQSNNTHDKQDKTTGLTTVTTWNWRRVITTHGKS